MFVECHRRELIDDAINFGVIAKKITYIKNYQIIVYLLKLEILNLD